MFTDFHYLFAGLVASATGGGVAPLRRVRVDGERGWWAGRGPGRRAGAEQAGDRGEAVKVAGQGGPDGPNVSSSPGDVAAGWSERSWSGCAVPAGCRLSLSVPSYYPL